MLFTPPTYGGKFYVCPRSTTPTPTSSSSSDNNPKRTGSYPTGPNASASAVANANVKTSLNQLPPIGESNTTTTTTSVKEVEVVEDPLNPRRGVQEGTRYGIPLKGFASEDPSGKTIPVLVYDVYHIRSSTPLLHPFLRLVFVFITAFHTNLTSLIIPVLVYDVYHIRSSTQLLHPFLRLYICIYTHSPSLNITVWWCNLPYLVLSCLIIHQQHILRTYGNHASYHHRETYPRSCCCQNQRKC